MIMASRILYIILCCIVFCLSCNAQDYYERVDSAEFYISKERWAEAERVLKDALRIEPGNILNSMLLSNLGYVQHSQGKLGDAIESYTVGLAMTPNSLVLKKHRASAYIDAGMIDEAYSDLSDAIRIESKNLWSRSKHGLIALEKGLLDVAKNDFETILDIDATSSEGLLGMALWADYSGEYRLAIDYITQLLEKRKNADDFFTRALLYIKVNDLPAADDDVREGLKLDSQMGDLYLLRAYLHKLRYRNQEAEIDKKLAIDYNADAQLVQQFFP